MWANRTSTFFRSRRDWRYWTVLLIARATSRAGSKGLRSILRWGAFGQHFDFNGQIWQSSWLVRYMFGFFFFMRQVGLRNLPAGQVYRFAATQYGLEHMSESIALSEATVTVLGERWVLGHRVLEPQPAEPPIRQVQMHFLAQSSLGTNAEAITDDQHPNHQLWIHWWSPGVAVKRDEVSAQVFEV
jgi:hypothetical protein